MKYTTKSILAATAFASILTASSQAATTIIDVTWGVGTGTNPTFTEIDNGLGGGGTWVQSSGLVTRGAHENSALSASSSTTFDPTAIGSDSLVLTTVVTSATGHLNSNGIFIGFQTRTNSADPATGTQLWNNLPQVFGFAIDGDRMLGQDTTRYRVGAYSSSTTSTDDFDPFGGLVATQASVNDGFSVTMTINAAGWQFALTGLETSDTTAITGGSGLWSDVALDFADFSTTSHASFSTQGGTGNFGTMQMGSLNLTQVPEPSVALLGGLGLLGLLRRRR